MSPESRLDSGSPAASAPSPPRRLGVVYEPDSVPIIALVPALERRWELAWIVRQELGAAELRQLRRFGECLDITEMPLPEAVARLRELGVAGITTFDDRGIADAARLARPLGVPGNSPEAAERLTNKLAQRAALAAAGLPTPGFRRVEPETSVTDLQQVMEGMSYPVVMKPAVGSGGRDTNAAGGFIELADDLQRRWSAGERRTLIVEECLGPYPPQPIDGYGDYGSVEVAVAAGELHILGVTGRLPLAPPFRETGMFTPPNWGATEEAAVRAAAADAIRALGVEVGCLHVEIKRTADGPRVIEVNGRVPGGGIPGLLLAATGTNLYAAAAAAAMGEPVAPAEGELRSVSYSLALQPPLGRPSRLVEGWRERLDSVPGIRHVEVRAEAVTARPQDGSYSYLLLVSGEIPTHEAFRSLHDELAALIEPAPLETVAPA